jgi:Leucine-rich repeat (LRR) protein
VKQSILLALALVSAIGLAGCGTKRAEDPASELGTGLTAATNASDGENGEVNQPSATEAAAQQRKDVAAIHRLGGKAIVDESRPGKPVIEVMLCGNRVTDADLAQLQEMNQLQSLDLNSTQVTDEGLVHLKGLAHLQSLNLGGTKVTDAGLQHVKRLPRLQVLWLSGTKVSDSGLRDLRKTLPNCQIVH